MENKVLIGTLTERYPNYLIVSGVRIDVTERVAVDQLPIGASVTVAYALEGAKKMATSIRRSTERANTPTG